jgi:S1-C subfamily serine protease
LKGEVVGINFATTSGADNISFALPINVMKSKLDEFRTYGKLLKPYLGVQYQMVSEAEASLYKNLVSGAMISRVSIDSPAAKADIRNGDIITEFGGEKVNVSLSMLIQKYKVGEEIEVKLHRGDQDLTVKVKLVEAQ